MADPYRMVVMNIISSLLLIGGLLVYRYVFKRNISWFTLLLLISILPIISIFRPGTYESGDFNIHLYRIMSFYDSLKEGILMPSWAAELNAGYGNPLFIFNYSLPYYLISFLHALGLSFIDSMKLYLALTLYLSGIFMYLWIKELLNNKFAAFGSSIFYVFSPYHLIDVHFRATLGESTLFMILPLFFLAITKYFKYKKLNNLISIALLTNLVFLAHPLVGSVFFLIAFLYILFIYARYESLRGAYFQTLALIAGLLASVYIWASFILYSPYMFKLPISSLNSVVPLIFFKHLFFVPWRFGLLFQGPNGELAHLIGYTQILVVFISIIMLIAKKIPKDIRPHYLYWLFIFLATLSLMTPTSSIFWSYINNFGAMTVLFGRLSLLISFSTSIIAGYFIFSLKRKYLILTYILLILTIGYTVLNWGHRKVIDEVNDEVLRSNIWKSTLAEGTTAYFLNTKWAEVNNFWFSEKAKNPIEIVNGKGKIKQIKRSSTKHTYILNAQTPVTLKENTLYFPGWSMKSNFGPINIYPGKRGLIYANLPEGLQYLELSYSDHPIYYTAKIISVLSLILFVSSLLFLHFSSQPKHLSRH